MVFYLKNLTDGCYEITVRHLIIKVCMCSHLQMIILNGNILICFILTKLERDSKLVSTI